jgi:Fe-S-cluster containining protein
LRKIGERCLFLQEKDGRTACAVYENRPHSCRRFPALRYFGIRGFDSRCPGVNRSSS